MLARRRFRQVHLDFHTSEHIPAIGAAFDPAHWQRTLREAQVDSITCFAKCHHGWFYHPTAYGRMHPNLGFDLLRAQMDASKAIGIAVPIYLTGGVDNVAAAEHPDWREIDHEGRLMGWARRPTDAGFHKLCLHSPYLDLLCDQIADSVARFPENDGVFIDIIYPTGCSCPWCMRVMAREGLDPTQPADRLRCGMLGIERYLARTTAAARSRRAQTPVFHNSSVLRRGWRQYLRHFSHVELESLPTGGWGYDHFPLAARYYGRTDHDVVGQTGKFHTTWGEFGGYKHPNALRYECAAMVALGARCSIGDQLHPDGRLEPATYRAIGAAYAEVAAKEPWLIGARQVADIGVLSVVALDPEAGAEHDADTGVVRLLGEGGFLYDVLDAEMPFDGYRLLILPDAITMTPPVQRLLDAYLARGGRLLLTGASGLDADGRACFDLGATIEGRSPFQPDYLRPVPELAASFCDAPIVMNRGSWRLRVAGGEPLGDVFDPYFNRDWRHFSSHQHTPNRPQPSGFAGGVRRGAITYLAHPVFSIYCGSGAVALREHLVRVVRLALGGEPTVSAALPSTARVTLAEQPHERRHVLHLLYAPTAVRGGPMHVAGGTLVTETKSVELIEDLVPLHDVVVRVRPGRAVARTTLEPQGVVVPHESVDDAVVLTVPRIECHQLVALRWA